MDWHRQQSKFTFLSNFAKKGICTLKLRNLVNYLLRREIKF